MTTCSPAWSPDGRRLVYVSLLPSGLDSDLLVMAADGSGVMNVTATVVIPQMSLFFPSWSPDGTRLLFLVECGECEFPDLDQSLYVMHVDGSGVTDLFALADPAFVGAGWAPAWSPDGSRIVFISDYGQVCVINADGTELACLTPEYGHANAPAWSPDGTRIAFAVEDVGHTDIHLINADGTGRTNLTNDPTMNLNPAWSPDGSHIAFVRAAPSGASDIYVMDADGTNQRNLTPGPERDLAPAWSPDGTRIAFISRSQVVSAVFVMRADGSDRQVIWATNSDWAPVWTP